MIPTIHAVVVQAIPGKPLVKQMEVAVNPMAQSEICPHIQRPVSKTLLSRVAPSTGLLQVRKPSQ
jgi:hypothetical protein